MLTHLAMQCTAVLCRLQETNAWLDLQLILTRLLGQSHLHSFGAATRTYSEQWTSLRGGSLQSGLLYCVLMTNLTLLVTTSILPRSPQITVGDSVRLEPEVTQMGFCEQKLWIQSVVQTDLDNVTQMVWFNAFFLPVASGCCLLQHYPAALQKQAVTCKTHLPEPWQSFYRKFHTSNVTKKPELSSAL